MKHYKRERNGRPLTDPGPVKGDPDGHGRYGVLDDDGETVACHECGARVAGLGAHVRVHEMSVREYKLAHGLPLSRSLSSTGEREHRSRLARDRLGTAGWARFEAARDPVAASAARDPESLRRAAQVRGPEHAARNGRAGRRGAVRACVVCRVPWCPLPGGYDVLTCSPQCWAVWQAWSTTSHRPRNAARDARIYADVVRRWRDPDEVAREHGIGRDRINQIVRQLSRTLPTAAPPARPPEGMAPSEADAWWVQRADDVSAYYTRHGHLPYTPHPDPVVNKLAWWLHQQRAHPPGPSRRGLFRRAYLDLAAPGWDQPPPEGATRR